MDTTSEFKHNDSLLQLSTEDLYAEVLKLRSACKTNQQLIDDRNQEVHNLKRQIESLKALELEYQQDIEHVISIESKKCKTFQDRIQELEKARDDRKAQNNEEFEFARTECKTLRETVTELEGKLSDAIRSSDTGELDALAARSEELISKYDFISDKYASSSQECQQLNIRLKELTEEQEESRNSYEANSADSKAKLTEQEEQIAVLRYELSNAQAAQQNTEQESHENRGNSMFSEVYDKWIVLKRKYDDIVKVHQTARNERNRLRNEASILRQENNSMCIRWKTEYIEAKQNDTDLINSYRFSYEKMENLVKKYEEELVKERNVNYSIPEKSTVYMNMIKSKNEQIEKLLKEFSELNVNTLRHRIEVRETNTKSRKYLQEATQYKHKVDVLQEQLEELQNPVEPSVKLKCDANSSKNSVHIAVQTESGLLGKVRGRMRDVTTMIVNSEQTQPDSFTNASSSEISIDDSVRYEGGGTKENLGSMSSVCKREGRVQFADNVPNSNVNEHRRRPRPRGRPVDCSQMIVVKRQSPKKINQLLV